MFTIVLWRSAHLTRMDAHAAKWKPTGRRALAAFVYMVAFHALAFLIVFAFFQASTWVTPMIVGGLFWISLAFFQRWMSKRGKAVCVGIGMSITSLAVALAALNLTDPLGPILASFGVLLVPFVGGCYHALKG